MTLCSGTLRRLRATVKATPPCVPRAPACLPICPTTPNRESRADDARRGQPFGGWFVGRFWQRTPSSGLAGSQHDHSPSLPFPSLRTPPTSWARAVRLSSDLPLPGARSSSLTSNQRRERAVTTDEDEEGRSTWPSPVGVRPRLFFSRTANFPSKRCRCGP